MKNLRILTNTYRAAPEARFSTKIALLVACLVVYFAFHATKTEETAPLLPGKQANNDSALTSRAQSSASPESENNVNTLPMHLKRESNLNRLIVPAQQTATTERPQTIDQQAKSKQTLREKRIEERNRKLKITKEQYDKMMEYASQRDWQAFLAIAQTLLTEGDRDSRFTITDAIREKAPDWVFKALLNSGAQFDSAHLFRVIRMEDLAFTQRLVALGLDIHAQSHNGENAINALAKLPYKTATLEYLLQQNVAIITPRTGTPQNGKSPVTEALTKALKYESPVLFAAKLLQYGAHPSAEDYALVENLKQQNPKAYQLVQVHIPELIRGE